MTSTEQATGSNDSTGERATKRRRNIILGAVAVGVLALALLAVGVLPRNSGTSGCTRSKPCDTTTTTAPSTGGGGAVVTTTTAPSTGGGGAVVTTTTTTP